MTSASISSLQPPNGPPRVTVIIPTCNRDNLLETCLAHLAQQTFQSFRIVVVDNGTRDAIPPALEAIPRLRWIPLFSNRGTATAFNRGLAEARQTPFVFLLNNDAELEDDCLLRLVQALEENPGYSVAVPKLLQWSDPARLDGAGDEVLLGGGAYRVGRGDLDGSRYDKAEPVLSACGAAALFRRSLFDDVGEFDEDFFAYREDVDLCLRAQLRGHRCIYVPQARARHRGSATLGSTFHPQIMRLTTRNQLLVLAKNYPASVLFVLLPRIIIFQILWMGLALKEGAFLSSCSGLLGALPMLLKTLVKRRRIMDTKLLSSGEMLEKLRESERRIWRWHSSVRNGHPSKLLTAYFWILGSPTTTQT
jgi:GT2 family glycosyltransferase